MVMDDNVNNSAELADVTDTTELATTKHQFYFEVSYLIVVIVIGNTGNLLIIATALTEKKLKNMGVAFIINLAVADLAITAWHLPVMLANILNGYQNVFENHMWVCRIAAVISSLCCEVSMSTLMFIAIYRYCQITRPIKSAKYFENKYIALMIAFIWIYCILIALPLITGWFGSPPLVHFDADMQACMWDDGGPFAYDLLVVLAAIFLQIVITAYMYGAIFRHVRNTAKAAKPCNSSNSQQLSTIVAISTDNLNAIDLQTASSNRRSKYRFSDRERSLLLTLVVVVVFFVLFWTPYALMTLVDALKTPIFARFSGWLALSNSAINGIIYGALNRNFRHGYMNILRRVGKPFVLCFVSLRSLAK